MIIFHVIIGSVFVLILWSIFYLFLKKRLSRYSVADSPFKIEKEISYCWAISISCLTLTGLCLVITAVNCPTHDFAPEIYTFFKVYSGIGFLGLALPIFWLVIRNQELGAEILQRKANEESLRKANMQLSESFEKLKAAEMQIVQHDRLRVLGEMASGIAHDFSNALMPITGLSELIIRDENIQNNPTELKEMLRNLSDASKDAKEVVRRLREFYKVDDSSSHVAIDINKIVESTVALTKPRWQAEKTTQGIYINVKTELGTVPSILGNESQLREALMNVVFNAVDALPNGGVITLKTAANDKQVIVEVNDSGMGMSEEVRCKLFQPFFTTKPQHGTGLGLCMALGIIKRHKGDIEIKSVPGNGTTVIFRFPVKTGGRMISHSSSKDFEYLDPLNVLLIDDNPRTQDILKRFLRAAKHKVELASTGKEGLDKFKAGKFDIVIVDRAMPDLSGDMVAGEMKKLKPSTPIIMITGFADNMRLKHEVPVGVDIILGKPIGFEELQGAIAELMFREEK